jgi:hypothetical protein
MVYNTAITLSGFRYCAVIWATATRVSFDLNRTKETMHGMRQKEMSITSRQAESPGVCQHKLILIAALEHLVRRCPPMRPGGC